MKQTYRRSTANVCVVWPFWSQCGALNWDSNYVYVRTVLPHLMRLLPNWLWVVTWPDGRGQDRSEWKWQDDGIFDAPNVLPFSYPFQPTMSEGVKHFDARRVRALERQYGVGTYWMHLIEFAAQMHGGVPPSASRPNRPAIVGQHHYVIHDSVMGDFRSNTARHLLQMIGTIAADRVVLNSEHTRRMMHEAFARHLSRERLHAIDDKSDVLPFGLVTEQDVARDVRPHDRPVIVYNHRTESYKNPRTTGDVLRDIKSRHDVEVWLTQYVGQHKSILPVDRIVGDPDRDAYLDNIAVPAINTINSQHETFCIAMLDSIALGHLPVAPNAVTFPELVPPDYPYLFETPTEQRRMLDEILSSWPDAYDRWSQRLREHARIKFRMDAYAERYADVLFHASGMWRHNSAKAHTRKGLDAVARAVQDASVSLDDVQRLCRKKTGSANRAMGVRRVMREMSVRGVRWRFWRDTIATVPNGDA